MIINSNLQKCCGPHCISLIDIYENENKSNLIELQRKNYYFNISYKKFHEDNHKIVFKFKKCGCTTHRICLMLQVKNNSDKNSFFCPSCDKKIFDIRDNLLNYIATKTLLLENIKIYNIPNTNDITQDLIFNTI
jgi:hypothetical protein